MMPASARPPTVAAPASPPTASEAAAYEGAAELRNRQRDNQGGSLGLASAAEASEQQHRERPERQEQHAGQMQRLEQQWPGLAARTRSTTGHHSSLYDGAAAGLGAALVRGSGGFFANSQQHSPPQPSPQPQSQALSDHLLDGAAALRRTAPSPAAAAQASAAVSAARAAVAQGSWLAEEGQLQSSADQYEAAAAWRNQLRAQMSSQQQGAAEEGKESEREHELVPTQPTGQLPPRPPAASLALQPQAVNRAAGAGAASKRVQRTQSQDKRAMERELQVRMMLLLCLSCCCSCCWSWCSY